MSRSPAGPGRSPRVGPKLVCCIGLLLAVAGGFALPEGAAVENWAVRVWVPLPDWLVVAAVASFSIACLIVIAMTRPWRRIRRREDDELKKEEEEPAPAWMSALLFLLSMIKTAMLIAAIFWLAQSDFLSVFDLGRMTSGDPATAVAASEAPWVPASPVTTGLIGALALLAGFGSLAFVLWVFFGERPRLPGDFAHPRGPLAAAVEDSLDDLRREPDARTAIVRIYGNFERVLAGVSLPRRAWETPVEFMRVVLMRLPLPTRAVHSLTEVFELARFSRHPIGAAERDSAWRSLLEIRGALDKERKPPDVAAS
jgi:hypothetical protein